MGTELSQLTFDYGELAKSEVTALERHAKSVERITERVRKTNSEAAIELGKILADAQKRLACDGHGTFQKWVKQRCGISPKSAYNAIKASDEFGDCVNFTRMADVSALYLLSSDTCPEEATREAIKLAEKGERITHKRAKELAEKYTVGDEAEEEEDDAEDADASDDWEPPSDWSLGSFILDTRRTVKRWVSKCPPSDIDSIADSLVELAEQIRSKKGMK